MKKKLALIAVTLLALLLTACGTPKFDSDGNPLVKTRLSKSGSKKEYQYNSKGDITKETTYSSRGKESTIKFKYGTNGQLSTVITYDKSGKLYTKVKYEYEGENRTKSYLYSSDNELVKWADFEYDNHGNKISMYDHHSQALLDESFEYEYDDDDNLIKESKFYRDGSVAEWTEYTYSEVEDGLTLKLEVKYDKDGNAGDYKEYYYDSDDRLVITVPHTSFEGSDFIMEYEYDEYGNELRVYAYREGEEPRLDFEYTYEFY